MYTNTLPEIQLMRSPLFLIFGLTVFLLSGCSRGPKEQLSVELVVDGRTVLEESEEGKKAEQLFNQHSELRNSFERACQFARFVGSRISHSTSPISKGTEIGNAGKSKLRADSSSVLEEYAEISLKTVPLDGQLVLCSSGGECVLQPAGSQPQPQYGLDAKSFLQNRYGMRTEASYIWRSASQSAGGDVMESEDDVRIIGDRLSCKSSVRTKGSS